MERIALLVMVSVLMSAPGQEVGLFLTVHPAVHETVR
jgi:hypothetical protein